MRKLLAIALCACAPAVPAVAFAANGNNTTTKNPPAAGAQKENERRDAGSQQRKAVARAERKQRARARKRAAKSFGGGHASPALQAIAACESGGNPSAIGGGGAYRGKYQFSYATWAAVGGHGDPAAASEAEQDSRAAQLYASSGAGQWPVCGR